MDLKAFQKAFPGPRKSLFQDLSPTPQQKKMRQICLKACSRLQDLRAFRCSHPDRLGNSGTRPPHAPPSHLLATRRLHTCACASCLHGRLMPRCLRFSPPYSRYTALEGLIKPFRALSHRQLMASTAEILGNARENPRKYLETKNKQLGVLGKPLEFLKEVKANRGKLMGDLGE